MQNNCNCDDLNKVKSHLIDLFDKLIIDEGIEYVDVLRSSIITVSVLAFRSCENTADAWSDLNAWLSEAYELYEQLMETADE
jgi:hypothetical protein